MNKDIPKPRPLAYLYITIPKEKLDEVEDDKAGLQLVNKLGRPRWGLNPKEYNPGQEVIISGVEELEQMRNETPEFIKQLMRDL